MNIIDFEQNHCQGVRAHLDSYIKGELAGDTGRDVSAHLEACGECAAEVTARRRLKTTLQHAVKQDVAPPALRYRIQREIRRQKPGFTFLPAPWQRWMLAAAATLALAIGGWGVFQASQSDNPEAAPAIVAATVTVEDLNVLNVGLGNHTHCAIDKGLAQKRFTDEEMRAKLGDGFAGLVPLVREKVSDGFIVVVGHTCRFQKREFVHLVLRRDEEVVSLTLTRKQGEAFSGGASESLASGSLPLRAARMEDYEVTGFETRDYLAFVVSNLPKRENGSMAAAVAPVVRDFLAKREA